MLNSQVYIEKDIKESIGRKRAHNYELRPDDLEEVADNLYTLHDEMRKVGVEGINIALKDVSFSVIFWKDEELLDFQERKWTWSGLQAFNLLLQERSVFVTLEMFRRSIMNNDRHI